MVVQPSVMLEEPREFSESLPVFAVITHTLWKPLFAVTRWSPVQMNLINCTSLKISSSFISFLCFHLFVTPYVTSRNIHLEKQTCISPIGWITDLKLGIKIAICKGLIKSWVFYNGWNFKFLKIHQAVSFPPSGTMARTLKVKTGEAWVGILFDDNVELFLWTRLNYGEWAICASKVSFQLAKY